MDRVRTIGVIRVITQDQNQVEAHGRLIEQWLPFVKTVSRCIPDQPQGVLIGDHCWIGQGATFTKNAIIPANTVVGLQSVVTKSFREEFTVLAGNPAKVIKNGVKWSREREMG